MCTVSFKSKKKKESRCPPLKNIALLLCDRASQWMETEHTQCCCRKGKDSSVIAHLLPAKLHGKMHTQIHYPAQTYSS